MLPRRATGLILVAPLVLAAGCASAERQAPNAKVATAAAVEKPKATINAGPTEAPSPTPAASTSSAAPAPTGTATGSAPAPGGNTVKTVSALNQFDPATLEIKVGDEVTWVSDGFHTVTGGDGPTLDPASPIGDNQLAAAGQTVKKKFDKPGTYKYFCVPHVSLGMKGEIVVK